jgi:hypothetical protein
MLQGQRPARGSHWPTVNARRYRAFQPARWIPASEDPCSLTAQQSRTSWCCASSTDQQQQQQQQPASPAREGRMTYRPASYAEMVGDAATAVLAAMGNNITRMEVEFPPIPTKIEGGELLAAAMHTLAVC